MVDKDPINLFPHTYRSHLYAVIPAGQEVPYGAAAVATHVGQL